MREDDAAGLALAERLHDWLEAQEVPVRLLKTRQLAPELAQEVASPDVAAVVIADARQAMDRQQPEPRVLVTSVEITGGASPSLSHHLDGVALLAYATLFSPTVPPAWLVTVPGSRFGHGRGLSPATHSTIEQALDDEGGELRRLLARLI